MLQKLIKTDTFYNKDNSYFRKSAADLILTEKVLCILHRTQNPGNHFAMGKVSNLYIAGTDKIPGAGREENLRMPDHQDFFWRTAGNLVSVTALGTAVFHYHNPFQKHYQKCRQDIEGDRKYITQKREKRKKEDFHLT